MEINKKGGPVIDLLKNHLPTLSYESWFFNFVFGGVSDYNFVHKKTRLSQFIRLTEPRSLKIGINRTQPRSHIRDRSSLFFPILVF